MPNPKQCFVSYSHSDTAVLAELLPRLQGLAHLYGFKVWHDRKIAGGHEWNATIEAAMDASDVFVCLVTDRFFGSTYIFEHELPTARAASMDRGALVIPVVFSGTMWRPYFGSYIQAVPTDSRTGALKCVLDWKPTRTGYDAAIAGIDGAISTWFGIKPANDFAASAGRTSP